MTSILTRIVLVMLLATLVLFAISTSRGLLGRPTLLPKFSPEMFELSDYPCGERSRHVFEITNTNSFPIRIVGIGGNCGPGGCVEPVDFRPFELAAKQRATVTVEFKSPMNPGPIEVSLTVHFSSDRVRSTEVHFSGNSVELVPPVN